MSKEAKEKIQYPKLQFILEHPALGHIEEMFASLHDPDINGWCELMPFEGGIYLAQTGKKFNDDFNADDAILLYASQRVNAFFMRSATGKLHKSENMVHLAPDKNTDYMVRWGSDSHERLQPIGIIINNRDGSIAFYHRHFSLWNGSAFVPQISKIFIETEDVVLHPEENIQKAEELFRGAPIFDYQKREMEKRGIMDLAYDAMRRLNRIHHFKHQLPKELIPRVQFIKQDQTYEVRFIVNLIGQNRIIGHSDMEYEEIHEVGDSYGFGSHIFFLETETKINGNVVGDFYLRYYDVEECVMKEMMLVQDVEISTSKFCYPTDLMPKKQREKMPQKTWEVAIRGPLFKMVRLLSGLDRAYKPKYI